ncbi:MAG TPA: carbohydrate kinase family protein, partial [Candidatus Limnocylindrales bacterium]|nr:carbohydrate kinase family protein [Candidatus Limnocylindrales bacterium]
MSGDLGARAGHAHRSRVLVLGDLMLDVVLVAARAVESATDVPGRVEIRQGGSAASTARWLGRLGVAAQLVCSIGRDGAGRSLVLQLERDGVTVHARRIAGSRTGRIGVLVAPGGERSFVADRRAADLLAPDDLRAEWFEKLDLVHLPIYSLLGDPLGRAGRRAIELARAHGALVSLDLASIGPLLSSGRRAARELIAGIHPDLLFATETEAHALLGRFAPDGLLEFAETVVIKRGERGARVVARRPGPPDVARPEDGVPGIEPEPPLAFDVATPTILTTDTTGAGDAFD